MPGRLSHRFVCSILCLSLSILAASPVHGEAISSPQLAADLAALETAIGNHPHLAHSVNGAELARAMRDVRERLTSPLSRDAAWREFATLNPILADGHLFVGFAGWRGDAEAYLAAGGAFFPFELDVTADADVMIKAALGGGSTPYAGAKLESINGVDAREVSRELLRRAHGDTPGFRAELISRRWFFYYWKLYGSPSEFDLVLRGAKRSSVRVPASTSKPLFLAQEASFDRQFSLELLPCATAVLTIRSFYWPDKQAYFEFTKSAFTKVRDAGVRTLIIDVRDNGGGDDDMWMQGILPYIADKPYRWASRYRVRVLEQYRDEGETVGDVLSGEIDRWAEPEPNNPLRYPGKTYVLIGPSTYSSAVLFANTVQHFGFATLAGAGGTARADQSGGVQGTLLPNTGLTVWWPRFVLTRPSGDSKSLFVKEEIPVASDPLRPGAAIDDLLARIGCHSEPPPFP